LEIATGPTVVFKAEEWLVVALGSEHWSPV